MRLLTPTGAARTSHCPLAILLFGAGMVGSAISKELQKSSSLSEAVLDLDWQRSDLFPAQLAAIESRLIEVLVQNSASASRGFQFIWSAGKAGFSSTVEQVSRELEVFEKILHCIEGLAYRFPDVPAAMVLISSAGGLFEGQRGVGIGCVPAPARPYSRLKLQQEQLLLRSRAPLTRKIYRLASIYGYIRNHQRRGLIPTLVADGLCHRSSQIVGYSTTMRDYVWIEDVAEYISRALLNEESAISDSVAILASGKPSSILEIQQIVEKAISRPLFLSFSSDVSNGVTTSFDAGALPEDWHPSELSINVQKIVVDAFSRQFTFTES